MPKKESKVIVFMNEKGGVGKTTGAREVAGVLKKNKKILLIDCDFQKNLSRSFLDEIPENTIFSVMTGGDIKDCILPICKNVDIIPGDLNLRNLDENLRDVPSVHEILKNKLEEIKNDYDYIIVDCRPAMSEMEKNALVCADFLITPIEAHYFSLDGLDILQGYSDTLKSFLKPSLKQLIYFNRVGLGKAPYDVIDDARADYKSIMTAFIKDNVKIKEASMTGKFLVDYAPRSIGATDFKTLVGEMRKNGI